MLGVNGHIQYTQGVRIEILTGYGAKHPYLSPKNYKKPNFLSFVSKFNTFLAMFKT